MKQIPFQPGCLGKSAAQSNSRSFTPPEALLAAALHPCIHPLPPGRNTGRCWEQSSGAQGQFPAPALSCPVNKTSGNPSAAGGEEEWKIGVRGRVQQGYLMAGLIHSGENTRHTGYTG